MILGTLHDNLIFGLVRDYVRNQGTRDIVMAPIIPFRNSLFYNGFPLNVEPDKVHPFLRIDA